MIRIRHALATALVSLMLEESGFEPLVPPREGTSYPSRWSRSSLGLPGNCENDGGTTGSNPACSSGESGELAYCAAGSSQSRQTPARTAGPSPDRSRSSPPASARRRRSGAVRSRMSRAGDRAVLSLSSRRLLECGTGRWTAAIKGTTGSHQTSEAPVSPSASRIASERRLALAALGPAQPHIVQTRSGQPQ